MKPGKKNPPPPYKQPVQRRRFLRTLATSAGVIGASLLGFIPVVRHWKKRQRPPGALAEPDFLASCIKCGQCVQVCPVHAIKLADVTDGFGVGTPFIDARAQACDFSCDGLQCVLSCPTGALTHHINYPHEATMAIAELVRPKACLAVQGQGFKGMARGEGFKGTLRYAEVDRWNPIPVSDHPYDLEVCDLCVRQCPIEIKIKQCEAGKPPSGDENQCPPKHAIRLAPMGDGTFMPEILEGCVGCGVCEMICPVEPTAIALAHAETRGNVV